MKVVIQTPVGITQTCPLEDGHLTYTSVPACVAEQIEQAIYSGKQFKGVAVYEDEDSRGEVYRAEFPWELKWD